MAQQTAVDWLIEESLKLEIKYLHNDLTPVEYNNLKEQLKKQANKIFEQQILVAWDSGKMDTNYNIIDGEDYYTQTYGK
jgi:hypothetical protein